MEPILIVGCGLSGSVIARELAERGRKVIIWERRDHIGGNMFDYADSYGIWVHKYGPHTFHTTDKQLYEYMCRYSDWQPYRLTCGAEIDEKNTPTPFNFQTIDDFYSPQDAALLKQKLTDAFAGRQTATVVEVLDHPDPMIRGYAQFLFEKDYRLYTAKQWGVPPEEIDASVLRRVPLRFSYDEGYFDDAYQAMPVHGFTKFFENLLNHPNITVELNREALDHLSVSADGPSLLIDKKQVPKCVIYTGALDELFGGEKGRLPYRSLRFEWKHENIESKQPYPVMAYPQAEGFTRITEYKKLPVQDVSGTSYAVEYPLAYRPESGSEPYYPVLTQESQRLYTDYLKKARKISNLLCCGRLADFQYYNMDQALRRALEVCETALEGF